MRAALRHAALFGPHVDFLRTSRPSLRGPALRTAVYPQCRFYASRFGSWPVAQEQGRVTLETRNDKTPSQQTLQHLWPREAKVSSAAHNTPEETIRKPRPYDWSKRAGPAKLARTSKQGEIASRRRRDKRAEETKLNEAWRARHAKRMKKFYTKHPPREEPAVAMENIQKSRLACSDSGIDATLLWEIKHISRKLNQIVSNKYSIPSPWFPYLERHLRRPRNESESHWFLKYLQKNRLDGWRSKTLHKSTNGNMDGRLTFYVWARSFANFGADSQLFVNSPLSKSENDTPFLTGSDATYAIEVARQLSDLDTTTDIRAAWLRSRPPASMHSHAFWARMILSAFQERPRKAILILEATLEASESVPFYAVADLVVLISHNIARQKFKTAVERAAIGDQILGLFGKILDTYPQDTIQTFERVMAQFSTLLPTTRHVADLWDMLHAAKQKFKEGHVFPFVNRLAADPEYKQKAFQIMQWMVVSKDAGFSGNDQVRYGKLITTLLDGKPTDQDSVFDYEHALEYFINVGLKPNIITFTSFLGTLFWHGEPEKAFHLARLFTQADGGSQERLDDKACIILLRGAKSTANPEFLRQALALSKASTIHRTAVLDYCLHSIYVFAENELRQQSTGPPWTLPVFGPLLHAYIKQFPLESLQEWIPDIPPSLLAPESAHLLEKADLKNGFAVNQRKGWDFQKTFVPVIDEYFVSEEGSKHEPTGNTLTTMLRGYIRSLANIHDIVAFYDYFKSKLEAAGPHRQLAHRMLGSGTSTILFDTFIMAMMERPGMSGVTQPAMRVFGDMLKEHHRRATAAAKAEVKTDAHVANAEIAEANLWAEPNLDAFMDVVAEPQALDNVSSLIPAPSQFTFNVLLRGLFGRGERILVAQVLEIMRELKIKPSLPTWNLLIRHHALEQQPRETVQALQDLEAEGLRPNHYTYEAFNLLKDRHKEKAFELMDSIIEENKKMLVQELSLKPPGLHSQRLATLT